jgi:Spy/CpxP family protein refolding chaperone
MTRFRSLTAGVLVVGLLASTGVAFAQGPGRPGGPGRAGGRGLRLGGPGGDITPPLGQLNLSDAQRQQISDITKRRSEQGQQVEERLRAAIDAQRKAAETLPVNEGAIRATAQELALAEAEVAIHRAHTRAEIFAVLTAEQQDQLKKLQADRAARVDQRRDRLDDRQERRQQKPQQ